MSLASIYLHDSDVLLASGDDLKDYFYQFKVGPERIRKNVLSTQLAADEALYVFDRKFEPAECPVAIGLSTLAMGDICAVEFARCSHIALRLTHGVMNIGEIITLKGSLPRGLLRTGIIVDDLIVLEQMSRDNYANPQPGSPFPHNPKKGFVELYTVFISQTVAYVFDNHESLQPWSSP